MSPKAISLKTLTMDELAGVVNLYPWYGAARKELCRRMAGIGADSWGINQFADQAMYVGDRGLIADIMRSGNAKDYSDKNLEELVRSYIIEDNKPVANVNDNVAEPKRKPAMPPKVAITKVTTPIMVEASQILVFKKARLMPTAKASMLVAIASTIISLVV